MNSQNITQIKSWKCSNLDGLLVWWIIYYFRCVNIACKIIMSEPTIKFVHIITLMLYLFLI